MKAFFLGGLVLIFAYSLTSNNWYAFASYVIGAIFACGAWIEADDKPESP